MQSIEPKFQHFHQVLSKYDPYIYNRDTSRIHRQIRFGRATVSRPDCDDNTNENQTYMHTRYGKFLQRLLVEGNGHN